jgi:transposase-like protein
MKMIDIEDVILTEENVAEVARKTGRPEDALRRGLEQAKERNQIVHIHIEQEVSIYREEEDD